MSEEIKTAATETEAAEGKAKAAPRRAKKKTVKQVSQGCAFVQATYNNTMVTITDLQGNTLAWSSAGHLGFKGPKKSTPYAASMVIRELAEKVQPFGLREIQVFVRGVGSGRESAIRGLNAQGFIVSTIKDITPIPHNGCRAPRLRRV
ncbi:MAG: 30S ribosomal protein S11 [bacterium]|nr:30S ribosomal protein S11 [bacterium]